MAPKRLCFNAELRDSVASWKILQKRRKRTGGKAARQNTGLNSAGPQGLAADNDRLKPWRHGLRGKSAAETCANQLLLPNPCSEKKTKKTKNYLSIAQVRIIIILFNSKQLGSSKNADSLDLP